MFRDTVFELLNTSLQKRPDLFLIDFEILEGNRIRVIIDGDRGVVVGDCIYVSRAIEHNLDREDQDFSLEVSSVGASSPLTHMRQYKKNIGRRIKVETFEKQKYEAVLTAADDINIVLEWKARESKPIGKGKVTVEKKVTIPYQNIEKSQIKLVF